MRFIPSIIHGPLDYLVGIALITAPTLLDFGDRTAVLVSISFGVITILYSIVTDYELGFLKLIPLRVHLRIDFVAGVFLCTSPWLFGFGDYTWVTQVLIGLIEIFLSITSRTSLHTEPAGYSLPRTNAGRSRNNPRNPSNISRHGH